MPAVLSLSPGRSCGVASSVQPDSTPESRFSKRKRAQRRDQLRRMFRRLEKLCTWLTDAKPKHRKMWSVYVNGLQNLTTQMGPYDVSKLLFCFRKAQYVHSTLLQDATSAVKEKQLFRKIKKKQLAMSIHSLGVLSREHRSGRTSGGEPGGDRQELFRGARDFMNALVQQTVLKARLTRFDEQELSNILYGIAMMEYKESMVPGDETSKLFPMKAIELLSREAVRGRRLRKYSGQGLVLVIKALGHLGYRKEKGWKSLCEELAKPQRLQNISRRGLSIVLCTLTAIEDIDEHLLGSLCKQVVRPDRIGLFEVQELMALVYALGQKQNKDYAILKCLCKETFKPERLVWFTEQKLLRFIGELGNLGDLRTQALMSLLHVASSTKDLMALMSPLGEPECGNVLGSSSETRSTGSKKL